MPKNKKPSESFTNFILLKSPETGKNDSGETQQKEVFENKLPPEQNLSNIDEVSKTVSIIAHNLEIQARNTQNWFYFLTFIIIFVSVFNILFISSLGLNNGGDTSGNVKSEVVKLQENKISKNESMSITSFYGNLAFVEFGAKLEVTKDKVVTTNHPNCQTPILPPAPNGCNLTLSPSLLGLPKRGVIFSSLRVGGDVSGDSELRIEFKNLQKGTIEKTIGTITAASKSEPVLLPEVIDSFSALNFVFWDKNGLININKIEISYFYVENLSKVTGKLNTTRDIQGKTAKVIRDISETGVYDPAKFNTPWTCRPSFPGVKDIAFRSNGEFVISRDDQCYIDTKPDKWFTDNGQYSIPKGKWILVLDDKTGIPFEVTKDEQVLDLIWD